MQTPKQELFLLNWEIANLTQKLKTFSSMYSAIDLKTIDCLDRLMTMMHGFLTRKSVVPASNWDQDDQAIFNGYVFARSINCRACSRAVKTTKPSLLKHLAEHGAKNAKPKPKDKSSKPEESRKHKKLPPLYCEKPCLTTGCLPPSNDVLSKKMKKFLVVQPKAHLDKLASQQPDAAGRAVHELIVSDMREIVNTIAPNVAIHPFGSRVTGLGNDNSDLDVYMDLYGNINGDVHYTKEKMKAILQAVQDILYKSGEWSQFIPIISARTPILCAWSLKHKIQCDISFSNGLSLKNTELMRYFFELQPVCFNVARYVKEWTRYLSMEALNGYTVTLLVVFLFQLNKMLPSLYSLQRNEEAIHRIAHWRVDFKRQSLEQLKIAPVPETDTDLWIAKFFNYYGGVFKFETDMICVYLGTPQPKNNFKPNEGRIPSQMHLLEEHYAQLNLAEAHPVSDLLAYSKPMVVQDPFELNHNVAKGLSASNVSRFRTICKQTGEMLLASNGAES